MRTNRKKYRHFPWDRIIARLVTGTRSGNLLHLFTCQELILSDISLLENGKKGGGSTFTVAGDRDESPFLFVPEMNMADALFYRVVAEQDKRPDYVMR
jgi:hypothetical protein